MKTYRLHNCTARHRTYRTLAKCIWRKAAWISGEGEFALVAYCRQTTVTLHRRVEAAQSSKGIIDASGCGGACNGRHEIVRLVDPAAATQAGAGD